MFMSGGGSGRGCRPRVRSEILCFASSAREFLFQLSSDQDTEMCWGDGGYIYFWIGPRDLKRRNFKRIHTDYQCG
jgi:uncharacterized protein YwqG